MVDTRRAQSRKIKLIKINTPAEPAVHIVIPQPSDQAMASSSPAHDEHAHTIDVAMPLREQTIISYRLAPAIRQILRGFGGLPGPADPACSLQSLDLSISKMSVSVDTAPPLRPGISRNPDGTADLRLETHRSTVSESVVFNSVTGRRLPG